MNAERLRAALVARGCAWPAPLEVLDEVGSTNDRLRECARAGAPVWSVVAALRQTAGRGRRGRRWVSAPGNLHFSVMLPPPADVAALGLVPLVAGLAVAEALVEFGVEARLKWPNDVLASGRKLAGLLAEGSSSGGVQEWIVLGVGVNVAAEPGPQLSELRDAAVSLRALKGDTPDLEGVASAVLERLRCRHGELLAGGGRELLAAWRARALPWWGQAVEVESGSQHLRGIAVDVDPSGALVLRREDGGLVLVSEGEARELRRAAAHVR